MLLCTVATRACPVKDQFVEDIQEPLRSRRPERSRALTMTMARRNRRRRSGLRGVVPFELGPRRSTRRRERRGLVREAECDQDRPCDRGIGDDGAGAMRAIALGDVIAASVAVGVAF
jgi:hypothetical protein